jgi:hypothetical protein
VLLNLQSFIYAVTLGNAEVCFTDYTELYFVKAGGIGMIEYNVGLLLLHLFTGVECSD